MINLNSMTSINYAPMVFWPLSTAIGWIFPDQIWLIDQRGLKKVTLETLSNVSPNEHKDARRKRETLLQEAPIGFDPGKKTSFYHSYEKCSAFSAVGVTRSRNSHPVFDWGHISAKFGWPRNLTASRGVENPESLFIIKISGHATPPVLPREGSGRK